MANKFLAIQVDGLSHRKLKQASHQGKCPNMTRLLKNGYKAHKYNCGLPSNTPFAQAGIMYGKNDEIPGFTFVDKSIGKVLAVRNPLHTTIMEQRYLSQQKGILKNGRSYVNIFSGGADYTRLTTSKLINKHILRQTDIFALLADPRIAARVAYNTMRSSATFLEYLYEKANMTIKRLAQSSDFKYNVTRLFSSVIFEEIETSAVIRDLKKGIPRIYITYNGYDENSHHQGPSSPAAFEAVKSIDKKIGRLMKHAKDYDVYIFSDHGHTESVPFKKIYGESFENFIHRNMKKYKYTAQPHILKRKHANLTGLAHTIAKPFVHIEQAFHAMLAKNFRKRFRQISWNSHPYFLELSDPLANLYFNFDKNKNSVNEIEKRYPGLIDNLVNHPGIGLVAGVQGNKVKVFNKYGTATIAEKHSQNRFKGERFLRNYGDEKTLCEQISYFARMRNSGDLIIMGDYGHKDVVSFINHFGSHGSAGGEQMHPFFMTNADVNLSAVKNVNALYDIFIKYTS